MERWEYRCEEINLWPLQYADQEAECWKSLDELGLDGWEMVAVRWYEGKSPGMGSAIFKRRVEDWE